MKTFKEKIVPESKTKVCDGMTCDFCDRKSSDHSWDDSYFQVNETEVSVRLKHKEGKNYSGCDYGEEFSCDMCPDCFREKLVPFLKTISKNLLDYKEYDYS